MHLFEIKDHIANLAVVTTILQFLSGMYVTFPLFYYYEFISCSKVILNFKVYQQIKIFLALSASTM